MHAEYYTLNGNHIKEEIVYFQKMRLAVGKWVSRGPLIMKEVNWLAYNLLFQKDRLFWKLVLRQPSSIQMEISHLRLRYWYNRLKECIFLLLANVFVGIVPLVDLFWFTLRMALQVSQWRTWLKPKIIKIVFRFWKASPFCDFNKVFAESICKFMNVFAQCT